MIRILLVDDHVMIREALRLVLERQPDVEVTGEAGDGETALRMVATQAPDLIIMDVSLPGMSGIETTRRLRASHPEVKILALSTYLDHGIIEQMLDAGAHGYISKSEAGFELLQGIRNVLAGRSYLCPHAAAQIADGLRGGAGAESSASPLSPRERQIAILLAEGKSATDIAIQLHISPNTVDVHRRNLMRKLDLHNVVDLTKYAIRTGLIQA
ncbi:MAG: response regulator transcription factor [Pseudomonadota bacterium]